MTTPSPEQRQRALVGLTALSLREVRAIWRQLNLSEPERLRVPLVDIITAIADKYGSAAGTLAADWYDEARAVAVVAAGAFAATPADIPEVGRFEALAGWAVAAETPEQSLSRVEAGMSRIVLNQARDTTILAVASDPARPTYARHASANACAFCRMLAARGDVYASATSASRIVGRGTDTSTNVGRKRGRGRMALGIRARGTQSLGDKYHDHCKCTAIEIFPGSDYQEAPYVAEWRATYNDLKVTGGKYGAIDTKATLREMRKEFGSR